MSNIKFYCPIHKLMMTCSINCCQAVPLSNGYPSQSTPKTSTYLEFLQHFHDMGIDFNATTITIGNKWIGKKSSDQQYQIMKKDIRKHINRNKHRQEHTWYYYNFELQQNGQLHAHGIEVNTYLAPFHESFESYGKRNVHRESFKKMSNLNSYFEYIEKEKAYPTVTNITKKLLKELFTIQMDN